MQAVQRKASLHSRCSAHRACTRRARSPPMETETVGCTDVQNRIKKLSVTTIKVT